MPLSFYAPFLPFLISSHPSLLLPSLSSIYLALLSLSSLTMSLLLTIPIPSSLPLLTSFFFPSLPPSLLPSPPSLLPSPPWLLLSIPSLSPFLPYLPPSLLPLSLPPSLPPSPSRHSYFIVWHLNIHVHHVNLFQICFASFHLTWQLVPLDNDYA